MPEIHNSKSAFSSKSIDFVFCFSGFALVDGKGCYSTWPFIGLGLHDFVLVLFVGVDFKGLPYSGGSVTDLYFFVGDGHFLLRLIFNSPFINSMVTLNVWRFISFCLNPPDLLHVGAVGIGLIKHELGLLL